MSDIGVQMSGDDAAERRLRRVALFLQDLRSFWPLLVPVVTGWWREMFETEGAFGGARWHPLAASTLERKAQAGLRPDILQATGQAKRAAASPKRFVTPLSMVLTIDDSGPAHGPVLQYHQAGGPNLPARPLVFGDPLPPAAAADLRRVADEYVRDLLHRA